MRRSTRPRKASWRQGSPPAGVSFDKLTCGLRCAIARVRCARIVQPTCTTGSAWHTVSSPSRIWCLFETTEGICDANSVSHRYALAGVTATQHTWLYSVVLLHTVRVVTPMLQRSGKACACLVQRHWWNGTCSFLRRSGSTGSRSLPADWVGTLNCVSNKHPMHALWPGGRAELDEDSSLSSSTSSTSYPCASPPSMESNRLAGGVRMTP